MSYFRPEIQAMAGYKPGEQPQAGKFIKLNTNENPYPPSPAVARAIQEAATGLSRYPDPVGNAFRIAAAGMLGVEPDWILCGNGSDDILTVLTRALVGSSELLRLPYPSYILYRTLAQIQGAKYEEVPFAGDWSLTADFAAPASGLKLAFLPNPNSPSGTLVSADTIAEIARQLPCPLVVDEAYVDFAETDCVHLVREHANVMVTRTLSKSYGLAGLRFGYLVAQPQIIAELMKVKDSYNCDSLSIAAATAAISDQAWLRENVAKVNATRSMMQQQLQECGFQVTPSQANFVWCQRSDQPVKPLYEKLKANKVLVRHMDYDGWGDGLRISVGDPSQVEACMSLLRGMV